MMAVNIAQPVPDFAALFLAIHRHLFSVAAP
jgi:hypothetical protein